jgi:hypothetical protein
MSQTRNVDRTRVGLHRPSQLPYVSKGLEETHDSDEACSTELGPDFAARADCVM